MSTLSTLLLVLSTGASPAPFPLSIQDEALLLAATERETTLVELRANPARWLGEDVRFVLQFEDRVEDWDPYFSRFASQGWLGFRAWPDEVFTWNSGVFENPAPRLFVRRDTRLERLVRGARPYARYEAHARVREIFLGEPWIEVVELVPLPGEVGEGTLVHVSRARELVWNGQWDLALEQFERAKAGPLPPHALAAIEKEMIEAQEARERDDPDQRSRRRRLKRN